jgi:hypothetical protein
MKQGMFFILLIATVAVVGYTIYHYQQGSGVQSLAGSAQATMQSTALATPAATLTATATIQPTVLIVLPNTQSGPTQLPNTGVIDAQQVWLDTPLSTLLFGLLVTGATLFFFGRRR